MLTLFIKQYISITFVNVTTANRKLLWTGSWRAHSGRYKISKILIFTWTLRLYHGNKNWQLRSLQDQVHLLTAEMSAQFPRLTDQSLTVSHSLQ